MSSEGLEVCETQFCNLPTWDLALSSVVLIAFSSVSGWMWQRRSRERRFLVIRVCVCVGELFRIISYVQNLFLITICASIMLAAALIASFGWVKNTITVVYQTTQLAQDAPRWVPRYTTAMQVFVGLAYPLLTIFAQAKASAGCDTPSLITKLIVMLMFYGVGMPVIVAHFQIRKVVRSHARSMVDTFKNKKGEENADPYKKPMRKLLFQGIFMACVMIVQTIIFASQLGVQDGVACSMSSDILEFVVYQLWQSLLLWHSNVRGDADERRARASTSGNSKKSQSRTPMKSTSHEAPGKAPCQTVCIDQQAPRGGSGDNGSGGNATRAVHVTSQVPPVET